MNAWFFRRAAWSPQERPRKSCARLHCWNKPISFTRIGTFMPVAKHIRTLTCIPMNIDNLNPDQDELAVGRQSSPSRFGWSCRWANVGMHDLGCGVPAQNTDKLSLLGEAAKN